MASDTKVCCFSFKLEHRDINRYLLLNRKADKEIHSELTDVYLLYYDMLSKSLN